MANKLMQAFELVMKEFAQIWKNIKDFIIKSSEGEFYPCKPDIFWKTYTRVYERFDSSGHTHN